MRQRITNPNEILKMLAEDKTQKEIASHFGVSPAPDTPHFNQLTNKELKQ